MKKEERKVKVKEEISESGLWSLGLECRQRGNGKRSRRSGLGLGGLWAGRRGRPDLDLSDRPLTVSPPAHLTSGCSVTFLFLFSITSGTITSSPLSHWLSSHSVNSACTRHVFPAYFFFCSPYGLCLLPLDFVRNDAELPAVLLQPELLAVNAIIKLDKKKTRCYGTVEKMVPTAAISGHFISKFTALLVHFCVG